MDMCHILLGQASCTGQANCNHLLGIFIVMVLPQVWRGSLLEGESFPVVNADEVDSRHFLVHWECVLE